MAVILPFPLKQAAFDTEATAALGAAYDRAIAGFGSKPPKAVREVIAKRIVILASKGECNPLRLCEAALRGLGSPR
jgi:hypothetical protein